MKRPNFSALWDLLDRVLDKWDKAAAARREKERLRKRADEILSKHKRALDKGLLGERDRAELGRIMQVPNMDERRRLLVEFDERTRKPGPR